MSTSGWSTSGWEVTTRRLAGFFLLQTAIVATSGILKQLAQRDHSVFWPAAGVGLAALIVVRAGDRRKVLLAHGAAVAVGLALRGRTLDDALMFGLAQMAEVAGAAAVYLKLNRGRRVLQGGAAVVSLVAAAVVGAFIMAIAAGVINGLPDGFKATSAAAVFFGHLSGMSMLTPVFLIRGHRIFPSGRWPETLLQIATLFTVLGLVFREGDRPLGFLPFAALAWAAARLTPGLTAIELFVTAMVVTISTLRGWGLFASYGVEVHNITFASQLSVVYQLTLLGTILPLALSVNRVTTSVKNLAASEDLYRRTFEEAMLGMVMLDRTVGGGSTISRMNPVACNFLATTPDSVLGTGLLDHLFVADHDRVGTALAAVLDGRLDTWSGQVQLSQAAGVYTRTEELHVSMTLSPLRDSQGVVTRVAVQMADVTDAQLATERLADLALHDPLTGLANRTLLEDRLQYWLEISARDCTQVLLMYIDLDDFKDVNDTSGHETGDLLLLEVSRRLMESLRPQDTVARLGGDEFVVIAPEMPAEAEEASQILSSRLLSSLSAPYRIGGEAYSVGASIGLTLSRASSTPTSLMREADSAMYEAKRQGKNCRHLYEAAADAATNDRVIVLSELNNAFLRDEFELHIQPLIDLTTGAVVGGEALVRWRHPQKGLLPPAAWLGIAEDSDLVHRLGSWVIHEACRQAAHWQKTMGSESPIVHANVSARQLGHGTLLEDVRGALATTGLSADKLVLELTETQLERPDAAVKADFDGLRAEGIQIAADDFGTGYSSLTRLTDMPIDILKIDRTFVARMAEDDRARAVVAALVTMGATIGMEVVAEGVETVDEAHRLRDLGCGQGQGFLWSRPVPPEEFLDLAMHRVTVLDATPSRVTRAARSEVLGPR